MSSWWINGVERFQSTHPVRGATGVKSGSQLYTTISIHAPREGCDSFMVYSFLSPGISIHAPREGCDHPDFHG